jgi:hypothetical protein
MSLLSQLTHALHDDIGEGTFAGVKFDDMSRRELYAVIASLGATHQSLTVAQRFKGDEHLKTQTAKQRSAGEYSVAGWFS